MINPKCIPCGGLKGPKKKIPPLVCEGCGGKIYDKQDVAYYPGKFFGHPWCLGKKGTGQ